MPSLLMKACGWNRCPEVVSFPERYCQEHKVLVDASDRERRGSAAERGYDRRWQVESRLFRERNPLCAECLRNQRLTPTTLVDHIIPHKGDRKLFWDKNNWQSLCDACHNSKTAREDGGFGNLTC